MNPIRTERHMKIACIGAGASGLCFAYKLQRSFEDFSLTLFERNGAVGGVWVANRYPGCACDYDAHNYTFSWDQKADWTSVYAGAEEVQRYFDDFAQKHGLHDYCKFNTTVKRAQWDDISGRWGLQLQASGGVEWEEDFDILINASGLLSSPKWPEIPGLDGFGGLKLHSGAWPSLPVDLDGKRIGLIGNGSSGQQLLEALQPVAGQLTVFIRQPTWVLGPFAAPPRSYTADELQHFADHPEQLLAKRKQFENRVNSYFEICLKDSPQQAALREHLTKRIRDQLAGSKYEADVNREDLEAAFIPQYGVGCRRPTPGTKYVESLAADNINLVLGPISHVDSDGVVDHRGTSHPVDALVCATGFETSHRPSFPIVGRGGRDLRELWAQEATAYLALAVPDFPNYFVFYGPNNPFASGPFLATIEAQADYMLKWCNRWQTENIHSFAPKQEAVEEFAEYADGLVRKTVWSDPCRSWYKSAPSQPAKVSLWPGSGLHYLEAISSLRSDDYDVRYKGNRWDWLGNGFSQVEMDEECDLSYYIREVDDGEFLSSKKRRRALAKGRHVDRQTLHVIE
ncbi:FAD-binding monooxygenase moxY [Apiospora marii]|uniref:FAD-binding monooxygenase moxY n=1 Tax=Apiospora marii TaxID=335849 RepID=A0ABR1RUZ8_9PEZI